MTRKDYYVKEAMRRIERESAEPYAEHDWSYLNDPDELIARRGVVGAQLVA